jgi:ribosomal protein L32
MTDSATARTRPTGPTSTTQSSLRPRNEPTRQKGRQRLFHADGTRLTMLSQTSCEQCRAELRRAHARRTCALRRLRGR